MTKQIKFGDDAREQMLAGMKIVSDTVSITMGPKGRNVIMDKGFGTPQVTNDGATIAREIELEDRFQSMGAELVKDAADRTNNIAGDGTTTSTILTYALAKEGMRYIKSGVNAVELKNGMREAALKVIEELTKNSKELSKKEEIAQIASISAQDNEVGEIIADAMEKVGNNGVISVEEGQRFGLVVETTIGMEFDSGYLSPYMVTNAEKMTSEMKNAPILITDSKISNTKELLPLLEKLIADGKKDLVIMAEDVDGEALNTIILNRLKGVLNVLALKNPGFSNLKTDIVKDIATLVGANVVIKDLGMKLENVELKDLGYADNIVSSQNKTIIIGGKGDKNDINDRVIELKNKIDNTTVTFEREKLIERLAKLDGGVAVIKVGAASEVESKEKKLRIEDALNATRAAVSEGVVAGGGVALLKASNILDDIDLGNEDRNTGASIVKQALKYPISQITTNAGKESSVIVNEVIKNSNINYGYDAANDKYVDMLETGIIDPKKVERVALQEAVSLAGMFLTTEAAISKKIGKKPEIPSMPGMGGIPMM